MSTLFTELMKARGVTEEFLNPCYDDCVSPFLLPDAKKAVGRIKSAALKNEKVLIYGDYDVDGVTASTVMKNALELAGIKDIDIMLPDRFKDGYGMSEKIVREAVKKGWQLVITVDCGSGDWRIVDKLNKIGIDVIVTDHHELTNKLPNAVAVVNPKRRDIQVCVDNWEENMDAILLLRDLAGAGVAFTLARAMVMSGMIQPGQEKWLLDLVVIGTICDSMMMSAENRRLCYYGMKVLKKTRRVGLKELLKHVGKQELSSEVIGFQIGPRLNAAGRMSSAEKALDLLNEKTVVEAAKLVGELEVLNQRRRTEQNQAVREIEARGINSEPVLIYSGDWHEGVLGIIAGRLVEEYKKPAFVFSEGNEFLKGSGRSFGDFNLAEALSTCKPLIVGGGGHAGACGVKVRKTDFTAFKSAINEYYKGLGLVNQSRFLDIKEDLAVLSLGEFSLDFLNELKALEPFGVGNEMPIFLLQDMFVLDKGLMGDSGQHLRLLVRGRDGKTMKLVAFNVPKEWREITKSQRVNLWITLERNEWNGVTSVEGRILKIGLY